MAIILGFLDRLIESDQQKLLYQLVWDEFSGPIRLLIDNQYVFQPFWDHKNGRSSEAEWRKEFQQSRTAASRALGRMETK